MALSLFDRLLSKISGFSRHEDAVEGYQWYLSHISDTKRHFYNGLRHQSDQVAAVSAPLLTHVSIMVAAIALVLVTFKDKFSYVKISILSFEAFLYLIIAIGCLRCIHVKIDRDQINRISSLRNDTSLDGQAHRIFLEDRSEVMLKMFLFSRINNAAIALTAVMIVSTPLILIF